MDNTQAAAVLREMIANDEAVPVWAEEELGAVKRGADALGMLEWLFVPGRFGLLHSGFMKPSAGETTFRAFCEAKFAESKNG